MCVCVLCTVNVLFIETSLERNVGTGVLYGQTSSGETV